ncbi:hypothetical protein PR202_ga26158 [Eleusine coracana subsp. coracana]|uniref:C2H2-type domain-containing protein n=1 Tax=Eleusine coracana subsp. coracana TaxID=191504 RepID=A0AAV5DCU5_ELECO|nr:hypothetical protein QOZ80_3AG0243370 [Eleusine coracana subsp. coracana]GJN08253.1 hypothetical protein PR202_ga26158 [Eleusine coracana subsp. coracana]
MAYGKRSRQQAEEMIWLPDGTDMAHFMLLFSSHHHGSAAAADTASTTPEKVFECKTCNRRFPSFQALGGHRASHKKPRLADGEAVEPPKPKVHGCSICGLQFSIGQALGGHMRRHRAVEADGIGMGLSLGVGPTKDDVVKKTAPAELVLDLNEPAMEEEPAPDRVKLGLAAEFPIAVDFLC